MVGDGMTHRSSTERTDHDLCPRCGVRFLPATYPGALSRADNKTEICSQCGLIEAMQQWTTGGMLIPVTGWPTNDSDVTGETLATVEQMTSIRRDGP
jgi:RNA polymerase subunit RPABC4/transcription elongation factor Spt4